MVPELGLERQTCLVEGNSVMMFGVGVSGAETGAGGDSRSPAEIDPLELREVTTDLRDQLPCLTRASP